MSRDEMSMLFDVLFNNITSNQAPGINEFEKSVFLTKAQNQLVMEYFNQRIDQVGGGFDGSQKRQYDFSSLIKTMVLNACTPDNKFDRRSKCYLFPSDYFLSVNEIIEDSQYQYAVMPIDYNEYYRLMQKPFAFPPKKTVWRLITGKKTVDGDDYPVVEVIGSIITRKETSELTYRMRYVHQLNPIILTDLSAEYGTDVKIDGKQEPTDCELPEESHEEIVERAVTLAKIAWAGGTATQAAAQRSKD